MEHSEQPLGLPPGSVRAIAFLLLLLGVILSPLFVLGVEDAEFYKDFLKGYFLFISNALMVVLGWYYGKRSARKDHRRSDENNHAD